MYLTAYILLIVEDHPPTRFPDGHEEIYSSAAMFISEYSTYMHEYTPVVKLARSKTWRAPLGIAQQQSVRKFV